MSKTLPPGKTVWTYEDYLETPRDDGNRYEILEGELCVTAAPSNRHQRVSRRLFVVLHRYCEETRWGEVLYAPSAVVLSETTVVEPDLYAVGATRSGIVTDRYTEGPPDLCVEIRSPSTPSQEVAKRLQAYARHGVRECWVLDPDERTLYAYRSQGQEYGQPEVFNGDAVFRPPSFPGLEIDLKHVWA